MKKARALLLVQAAVFFLLLGTPGIAPVSPAAARGFNSWEGAEETADSPAADFLREHGKLVFTGVAVALFLIFSVMMGPIGRYPRRRPFGGFGTNGGFGGNITTKNPWE